MLGAAYGMRPADFGAMIHRTLDRDLATRQSLGRMWRKKCPHLSVCPKEAVNNLIQSTARTMYHPTIQAHPALGEPPMLGEFEWRNIPDRNLKGLAKFYSGTIPYTHRELMDYNRKDVELGYTIRHLGCTTGRSSCDANNIMEIPRRKKTKMNKQERNAAVRELDSTESDINKVEKQTAKLIAADQKKLEALEQKLSKRRSKLIDERDALTRPLYRRAQYLRHELAGAF